jgi:hypothetical protein
MAGTSPAMTGRMQDGGRMSVPEGRPSFCPVPGYLLGSAKKSNSKTGRFALEASLRIGAEIVDERT